MSHPVSLELGKRRVFACSLDWPGWCRAGRDDGDALNQLAAYAPRYAIVAAEAGIATFPSGVTVSELDVVEEVEGSGATDFGVPDKVAAADGLPADVTTLARFGELLDACWRLFDRVVGDAPPVLRKGPRGGGRDRDDIVAHVAESERSYARTLGVRYTPKDFARPGGQQAMRAELVAKLRTGGSGAPIVAGGWTARYAARRIAWHVLDHAWEIEDKSIVDGGA